jgi:hypothetical protein
VSVTQVLVLIEVELIDMPPDLRERDVLLLGEWIELVGETLHATTDDGELHDAIRIRKNTLVANVQARK